MKSEIKIEFDNSKKLSKFFEMSYTSDRIKKGENYLEVEEKDNIHDTIKSINNGIVRITNKDILDGFCRFIINSDGSKINLIPISLNYIFVDGRWIFF